MENPLLNFISPTVVTGNKSQVYVVIHEIAHSWTGDQVTMNNWEDFWLNKVSPPLSSDKPPQDFTEMISLKLRPCLEILRSWIPLEYTEQTTLTQASTQCSLATIPTTLSRRCPTKKGTSCCSSCAIWLEMLHFRISSSTTLLTTTYKALVHLERNALGQTGLASTSLIPYISTTF